jgi:hypothetical protein
MLCCCIPEVASAPDKPSDACRDIEFKDVDYDEPTEDAAAVEAFADAHPLEADC